MAADQWRDWHGGASSSWEVREPDEAGMINHTGKLSKGDVGMTQSGKSLVVSLGSAAHFWKIQGRYLKELFRCDGSVCRDTDNIFLLLLAKTVTFLWSKYII